MSDSPRTEIVKAIIVLEEPAQACDDLAIDIQRWVKQPLAANEYPREIQYIGELAMSATENNYTAKIK